MRVVFMGTPDFAVASVQAIYHSPHDVVGVVTTPDKPAGRGLKLQCSDVKKIAVENNIPVLQPPKLKDETFIEALKHWNADVFVVVAFRMLPAQVYEIPPKGAFNVHASLLPQYRGAAPIHWAIMNGETKTGITTFFLNQEIDCGDIILQKETDIKPNETTGELYDRLKISGAEAALETLSLIEKGNIALLPQPSLIENTLKFAPKIHKEDTIINWNFPAKDIINKIRGLSPYPGAVTFFTKSDGQKCAVKIFKASISDEKAAENAGEMESDGKTFLKIFSKDFKTLIHSLQFEGKNRMNVDAFLLGNNVKNYTIFT
jgi:methionyl-tRNA formyltransferase